MAPSRRTLSPHMNARFITYVIIGVAFGCTQLWFVYWVVKLFKEKQRVLAARRAGGPATASGPSATAGQGPVTAKAAKGAGTAAQRVPRPPRPTNER